MPAFTRYRDFLEKEYLPAAREAIAVSANPNGAACYAALVRYHSSLSLTAQQVHDTGRQQVEALDAEMQTIAQRSFGTGDVPALLERVRVEPTYLFKSRDDLIGYSQAALARAKEKMRGWFGLLPKADVVIQPYPKFREKSGPNEYNPPAEDGSRPAVFFINAYQAEKQEPRAGGIDGVPRDDPRAPPPGRHRPRAEDHSSDWPVSRQRRLSGRVGAVHGAAGRRDGAVFVGPGSARHALEPGPPRDRLVVDSGIHAIGWTRQQAIDYMLTHTAEPKDDIVSEVDRYIIYPGQATAYMLGSLEIRKAREEAQQSMGSRFDIKEFHDRVLEDGAVPVSFLHDKIRAWGQTK